MPKPLTLQTPQQAAAAWGVTPQLVRRWATEGRIPGASQFAGRWQIPAGTERPAALTTRPNRRKK